ncbi:phosphatase and actin regulator 2-like isoform X2 [Glandiceps talaboti]
MKKSSSRTRFWRIGRSSTLPADLGKSSGDVSKSNDMKSANAKVKGSCTPPVERKSKFSSIGRLFKPWKWKKKRKASSEKFHQTQITIERKISMRSTKEELIKKGVLSPDAYEDANNIPPGSIKGLLSDHSTEPVESTANSITSTPSSSSSSSSTTTTTTTTVHITSPPPLPQKKGGDKYESNTNQPSSSTEASIPGESGNTDKEGKPSLPRKAGVSFAVESATDATTAQQNNTQSGTMGISSSEEAKVEIVEMNKENHDPTTRSRIPVPGGVSVFSPVVMDSSRMANGDVPRYDSDSDSEPILYRDEETDSEEESELASKVKRKDSLAIKLSNRPSRNVLVDRNIISDRSENDKKVEKTSIGAKLERRLSLRPTQEELEQRNIMRKTSQKEDYENRELTRSILTRKLSFRPTVEELKRRNILKFCDYVEVTQAIDYDRKADKPWTRLTPQDKAAIRKELNDYKSAEMEVHAESRQYTRFHRP